MPTATAPVQYPLGPPVVTGPSLTVDMALQQPTRVTRRLSDITLQRFITTYLFAAGGGVTGGAVVYDQLLLNELYTSRDVESVGPGDEFPIVTSERQTPQVARVDKWGGKIFITDEARDRNDVAHFNNEVGKLGNTIVKRINTNAVATLEATITAFAGALTFTGNNWSAVVTGGASQTNASGWPAADLAKATMLADIDELGVVYDTLLLNPAQYAQLAVVYGPNFLEVLRALGYTAYSSNRVPAGTGYFAARGQVGELRVEKALGTETWREEKNQRTWLQASVRPVMYITNPYSVRKVVGLAG